MCSNNITYNLALLIYKTITREIFGLSVNYVPAAPLSGILLQTDTLTIIHESNTILSSLYILEDRKYTRIQTEVHRFEGPTEHDCLYGGLMFRLESLQTVAAGVVGPYCNNTENDPLIRGRNELTLSGGFNQLLIYAYSRYFKINITFHFSTDVCEGIIKICDMPIFASETIDKDGLTHVKHIYHRDSYVATYHAFFMEDRKRHPSIEITLVAKPARCFNIQNMRSTLSLKFTVYSCTITIVPEVSGIINLMARASFRPEAVHFYHIKKCGEIASFSQTNPDMSVTKHSLTYANTTAEAEGSHIEVYFGERYCYDGLGGYSITVKNAINHTCYQYNIKADAQSTSYVECAVLTFPRLQQYAFSLRLIAHEDDDRLPLDQVVSKSVYYYYITISQTSQSCKSRHWYFIGRVQLTQFLGSSCSTDNRCFVRGSVDEILQEDNDNITFRTYTKLLHFLVGRYKKACPFTIGFSTAQYIVNTNETTDANCTFQVSSNLFQ